MSGREGQKELRALLESLAGGQISVDTTLERLAERISVEPQSLDLGFATLDLERRLRQGVTEVVYAAGKEAGQIRAIAEALQAAGQERVLITRLSPDKAQSLEDLPDFCYNRQGQIGRLGPLPEADGLGTVLILTAGTSDLAVAEEAAWTLEYLGNRVERLNDVGVAGLHRLLSQLERLRQASVIIVIAGMEGALASVVGGLVDCPVLAVPSSVGYGTAFGGVTALLSMLNACSAGIAVLNIDNGFGAAYMAHKINHMGGNCG